MSQIYLAGAWEIQHGNVTVTFTADVVVTVSSKLNPSILLYSPIF